MGMTIIEKILARASGRAQVSVGEVVVCRVDRIVLLDLPFTSGTDPLPKRIVDPERVSIIMDHAVPAPSVQDAVGHQKAREFARKHSC